MRAGLSAPRAITQAFCWYSDLESKSHLNLLRKEVLHLAFINTRESIGEQALFDLLVSHQITEFNDDSVTELRSFALMNQSNLISASFPSLSTMGQGAIRDCPELVDLDLGMVANIGSDNFNACPKLNSLVLRSSSLPPLSSAGIFAGTNFAKCNAIIYVPRTLLSSYKAPVSRWAPYRACIFPIEDMPVSDCETIDLTWAQIKSAIDDESFFESGYAIGDIKKVIYSDGSTSHAVYFEIAKIDSTNKYVDFICFGIPENNIRIFNSTMSYYSDSIPKARLDDIYENELPSDLKAVISPVTKYYYSYDGSTEEVTSPLWLLNTKDVNASGSYLKESVGENYEIFTNNNTRLKFVMTGGSSGWWLGSAYSGSAFVSISNAGSINSTSISNLDGLIFGFRIQKTTT